METIEQPGSVDCFTNAQGRAASAAATRDFAQRFVLSAPRGVQVAKRAVYRGFEMSLEAALDFVRPQISALRHTQDHSKELRALQERRLPRFEGR